MQRKGDSAMKIRFDWISRAVQNRLMVVLFVLQLLMLSTAALLAGRMTYVATEMLFFAQFKTVFALLFAAAFTVLTAWFAWFLFSLVLRVWKKFNLHLAAVKASAGS